MEEHTPDFHAFPFSPAPESPQKKDIPAKWTEEKIRDLVQQKFSKRPCWFQLKTSIALYVHKKDVIGCAPTGAGKTLSFWIPLLMALEEGKDAMSVVVTPLNLLGKQNQEVLEKAGLRAVAITAENATKGMWKSVEDGAYHVIIVNPEILMGNKDLERLWKIPSFTKRLLNFVFDEGHCISQWGSFRQEYTHLGSLRYLIHEPIPFYVASATLPIPVMNDIVNILHLRVETTEKVLHSNDRPDIALMVRSLEHPMNGFHDLAFLIPDDYKTGDEMNPFLVFFDSKKESESACKAVRKRLPVSDQQKIRWFHADLTQEGREELCGMMRDGELFGLFCTDAFGMGMDLPNIKLVVQWRALCSLCTLWQRFGRAARGQHITGTAILLVEKKDTEKERQARAEKAIRKKDKDSSTTGRSKRKKSISNESDRPVKRQALTTQSPNLNELPESHTAATHPSLEPLSFEELKNRRRAGYNRGQGSVKWKNDTAGGKSKKMVVELGSPMDDFINAHLEFGCRRLIPMLVFDNDKRPVDDHLKCNPFQAEGCSRCKIQKITVCCDLCHPDAFTAFKSPEIKKSSKAPGKSNLKMLPKMTEIDHQLQNALFDWRDTTAVAELGPQMVDVYGSGLFFPVDLIVRVVDCARSHKLATVEQLIKETHWREDWANQYGPSLLAVVHHHIPPPTPLPPVLTDGSGSNNATTITVPEVATNAPLKRQQPTCSACLQVGHRKTNATCPKYEETRQARRKKADAENNPPPPPPIST